MKNQYACISLRSHERHQTLPIQMMRKQHAIVWASTAMKQGGITRYYKNYHTCK